MWEYNYYPSTNELYHHGILGQKWGKRNGPPYPLDKSDYSAAEKKAKAAGKRVASAESDVAKTHKYIKKAESKVTKYSRKATKAGAKEDKVRARLAKDQLKLTKAENKMARARSTDALQSANNKVMKREVQVNKDRMAADKLAKKTTKLDAKTSSWEKAVSDGQKALAKAEKKLNKLDAKAAAAYKEAGMDYVSKAIRHSAMDDDWLEHHGILGMKWGKRNGPPYPLDKSDLSEAEKKAAKLDKYTSKQTEKVSKVASKNTEVLRKRALKSGLKYEKKLTKYEQGKGSYKSAVKQASKYIDNYATYEQAKDVYSQNIDRLSKMTYTDMMAEKKQYRKDTAANVAHTIAMNGAAALSSAAIQNYAGVGIRLLYIPNTSYANDKRMMNRVDKEKNSKVYDDAYQRAANEVYGGPGAPVSHPKKKHA